MWNNITTLLKIANYDNIYIFFNWLNMFWNIRHIQVSDFYSCIRNINFCILLKWSEDVTDGKYLYFAYPLKWSEDVTEQWQIFILCIPFEKLYVLGVSPSFIFTLFCLTLIFVCKGGILKSTFYSLPNILDL